MIIAAKLGILWNGTKSPHPKSLPRFFTRVMCRQKDDSVGQLLKKLATAHVPNKDSERASDADIGRKEAGFGPIVLASNHLSGRLGSAHLDPPELNIKEKQVTAHVPAKQHCSTDVQSSSDANVCRNKTEGCGTGEAKIRRLQKDLDVATWRNKEMNRGWNSTIQDGLHAVADLQKLVAGNLVTALADADVHEINWTILEQLRFEFDEDQEEVKHVLNSLFSDCLRQYRSRLKKKYFTGKITGSVPTISPFKQMTDKQWGDLVKHWSDPKNMLVNWSGSFIAVLSAMNGTVASPLCCAATQQLFLLLYRKRTPDEAEELLAKISKNHDDWSTPEPTPTPILKKRGMIELNDEDMREAKKSLMEKGIKSEDVKNLPPIEDLCKIIPPSSTIEKRKMDNYNFGEVFEGETTSTGRPSRASTRIRRSYNEDVIAPSFEPEEDNGAPNASPFPCYNFLSNAGLLDDFLTLVRKAGLTTYMEDERKQYYMLTKIFVESFKFNNKHFHPTVAFKIYGNPVTMKLKDFCAALDIAPAGTARKIEDNPKALLELYREITNDDCRTIQRGKIRNIQLPAIKYFAYYLATSILGRENTSNISSYHLAFLIAALTGETPYHLGALVARRLSNKGPIYGGIIASRILARLDLPLDPTDVEIPPVSPPAPNDLFSVHRQPWSRSKEEVDEQLKIQGFHQQHDSEDAEPSYDYTVTYPVASSSTYLEPGRSSSYYGDTTSWGPWE
ncbi:hypothetical protein QYE76_068621 [Lolium multiflorum]|uniref:Arabidopsis retrotransposon Orf1 C-terminal domain-containing protein n=1 Tax=Lolium multiflorum TaxID=4521 RepID=A0AAD8SG55_LOLMU|nr:hypothetical protein QYE76_068621 [Lolium multiflorum]